MRNAHVKVKLLHTRKEQGREKKKRGGDLARRLKKILLQSVCFPSAKAQRKQLLL